jgi:hypothetical protein
MEDWHKGLKPETLEVFEPISKMDSIKGLYLCGGTAVSLQLQHRQSEDLDFEFLATRRNQIPEFNISEIVEELNLLFPENRREILGSDHVQFYVGKNVKLSFFRPKDPVPMLNNGFVHNNLRAPSLQDLLGMKLFTISVRFAFRDYYDIYSLLRAGCSLTDGILYACKFSQHKIKSKQLYTTLLTPHLFVTDEKSGLLAPKYSISSEEIAEFIKTKI